MEAIRIECSNGYTLETRGGNLVIITKKEEETVPISRIQSFSIKKPGLAYGKITFKTAQAQSVGVAFGGIMAGFGAEREFFYSKGDVAKAEALRDYVQNYSDAPAPAPSAPAAEKTVVSVVDEIRGLKQLLDEGILTEEEFTAKKKQLLSI